VANNCHANFGKEAFVHGPVASGDCTLCHIQTKKHKFEPITNAGKLCTECHERLDTEKVVHKPVKDGKCTQCHDPHQSSNRFMLRGAGADLCFRCHDKAIVGGKYVHGPVAVGSCSTCHSVHQSQFPKMLLAEGNEVCFACHSDKAEAIKARKFIHAPVDEACVNCHNPHSGNFRFNLPADGARDLCFTCHSEKATEIAGATVKHGGLDTEKKCLRCHDPHVSDYVKQLTQEPADLCLSCHDREYTKPTGKVANMKELLANNAIHHGPIKQKDCSSCHNAHGSKNFRMLREYFPNTFYAGYDPNNYKLCFMCHEQSLASEERTTTMTGFRDGDRNLHAVHVNKPVKGRTCRACHDAHATNNPRHIRDAVPFGGWKLPVGFTKTETGGQCLPGCHQLLKYDRKNPVGNR
jgi:predicted CXXCH cytochrome family protein